MEINNLQQIRDVVGVGTRITEFYAVFGKLKQYEEETFGNQFEVTEEIEESLSTEEIVKKFEAGVFNKATKLYGKNSAPVVLIIDEINRGNVSSIFGELITLIEEDKRQGNEEEISVTLPYSKKKFSVPNNLYVIGTMNTADRSVEALDSALRRRFSFSEVQPNPQLIEKVGANKIEGFNTVEILEAINKRIEKLIDKDHKIGHSYFLKIKDLQGLKDVFHKNIIPLLQEYFFGDFGKIGLVIGSGFYTKKEEEKDNFFAAVEGYDFGGLNEKQTYDFVNVSEMSDDGFFDAINLLLG